jgi:hypothetical protein
MPPVVKLMQENRVSHCDHDNAMDPSLRTIQARTDDLTATLGPAENDLDGVRHWACGCSAKVRLGNELLCDWQMCAEHESLAPKMEIGGG